MMKATGVLVGICLTVAVFLLVMHNREKPPQETVVESVLEPTQTELSAIVTAIAEQVDVVPAGAEEDLTSPSGSESEWPDADPPSNSVENSGIDTAAEDPEVPHAGPEHETALPAENLSRLPADQIQKEADENSNDTGLYLFWSPFRSTWAAEGFAGRLTVSTQVPVEVVTTAPGEHRVAFSYRDETERLTRIKRIETITGLKLE